MGRLTAKVITQGTDFYDKAIRNNIDYVDQMHSAIWATYYHEISTDSNPQHHLCPPGQKNWCRWQRAKFDNNLSTFTHKNSLPQAVMKA